MTGERDAYLEPQEKLVIAAKVNRLCETAIEDFDPETQVQDAQDIVNALDSRVLNSKSISSIASVTRSSKSQVKAGATNAGQVNTAFDETKRSEVRFGEREYRIGFYVATKYKGGKQSKLDFEHFWDRGEVNETFEVDQTQTEIVYENKTLEIVAINKQIPKTRTLFPIIALFRISARISATTYSRVPIWQKQTPKPKE